MGVWIETVANSSPRTSVRSHPSWVCGLKHSGNPLPFYHSFVTPFVGVWIETSQTLSKYDVFLESHPSWVCGLKLISFNFRIKQHMSHPSWVCGLKLKIPLDNTKPVFEVTPFVGVWIETPVSLFVISPLLSHPSWVCGLKQSRSSALLLSSTVTPFVGVWIETTMVNIVGLALLSHTLRGCVD